EPVKVPRNRMAESHKLLELRDLGVATIEAQSSGLGEAAARDARAQLHTAWQDYVAEYGPINRSTAVYRKPTASQQARLLKQVETEWRAALPDDGEVSRQDIPVPDALWAQWEEDVQQPEFKPRNQAHLTFLRGEPKLGLLRAMEAFDEQTQTRSEERREGKR